MDNSHNNKEKSVPPSLVSGGKKNSGVTVANEANINIYLYLSTSIFADTFLKSLRKMQ